MIGGLKAYPAYKDSGLLWLGQVPEHWEVKRGKNLFRCIDIRSSTGEEELLTVSSEHGVVPRRSAIVTMFKAESYLGYKLCWPGDLVINSLWAWARGLGVSQFHGIVSTAYGVYRPRAGGDIDSRFIHELVRSTPFHWELRVRSKGVWTSRLQLTDESFLGAPFPLPPLPEQTAIVRFLDHANQRIERYIRAKKKLIALLNEQKQVIIHRAVTRGLDPNVRLKPFDIPGLGEIPEHWEIVPLKSVCYVQSGVTLGKNYLGANLVEYPYLRVANVQAGRLSLNIVKTLRLPENEARRSLLRQGDVLMTEGGDPDKLGRGCVWEGEINPCLHQNHIFAVRPSPQKLSPRFLAALLITSYAKDYFLLTAKQTTNLASTNKTTIGNFRVLLPSIEEQTRILQHLELDAKPVDNAIARTDREITMIREYRMRLVADVVTGQLDVRAAAAKLPDEPKDLEPLESELQSDDETMEASDLDAGIPEAGA